MMPYYQMNTFHIVMRSNSTYSGLTLSGGFRGGALGALAPQLSPWKKILTYLSSPQCTICTFLRVLYARFKSEHPRD